MRGDRVNPIKANRPVTLLVVTGRVLFPSPRALRPRGKRDLSLVRPRGLVAHRYPLLVGHSPLPLKRVTDFPAVPRIVRPAALRVPFAAMRPAPLWISCVLLALALTGCSSGFENEYKAITASSPPHDTIEGAWEGRWQSQAGHGGDKLRAILTKNGPDTYIAKFHAGYWGIFEADQE